MGLREEKAVEGEEGHEHGLLGLRGLTATGRTWDMESLGSFGQKSVMI